ncbi:MAG: 16S rRNA (guanine(966)-N(2))-methyltransferase RsmD [Nitrospira sp.]|nr:16S rRNA (guanine(966)-N(2))-methyltransferase RsmD [Nitrospira sp.]
MRVIAGTHKGRRLTKPDGNNLRPTSTRVREALFSILSPRIQGAGILDLYAGTGALSLESLSRGASHAVCVEHHTGSLRILRENVTRCGYDTQCRIISRKVETYLAAPPSDDTSSVFDIIFADPPYHTSDAAPLLERLDRSGTVSARGVVILEHFFKHHVPQTVGSLTQTRQVRYGDTMLTFFQPRQRIYANSRLPGHL